MALIAQVGVSASRISRPFFADSASSRRHVNQGERVLVAVRLVACDARGGFIDCIICNDNRTTPLFIWTHHLEPVDLGYIALILVPAGVFVVADTTDVSIHCWVTQSVSAASAAHVKGTHYTVE